MMKCSPEAFAKCPTHELCGHIEDATFAEGSECDKFNQKVERECSGMSDRKYVIVANRHPSWPAGSLLFWGRYTEDHEERSYGGYTTRYDQCEKYTREELRKWRGGMRDHYPFFDELKISDWNDFREHDEVLCTLEELLSIGYQVWTVICRP